MGPATITIGSAHFGIRYANGESGPTKRPYWGVDCAVAPLCASPDETQP